jgi:hypothetical protein
LGMGLLDSFGGIRKKNKDTTGLPGPTDIAITAQPNQSKTTELPPPQKEQEMPPRTGKFPTPPDTVVPGTVVPGNHPVNVAAITGAGAAPQPPPTNAPPSTNDPNQGRPQVATFPIIGMVNPKHKIRATDQDSLPAIESCSRSPTDVFDAKIMIWPVVVVAALKHAGVSKPSQRGADAKSDGSDDSGFLGIEFQPRFDRHFVVTEIARHGPSDLNAGVMIGDLLLAVNGVPIRNLVRPMYHSRIECISLSYTTKTLP